MHGGSAFLAKGMMASLWDWTQGSVASTPTGSRESSRHGGNAYGRQPASIGKMPATDEHMTAAEREAVVKIQSTERGRDVRVTVARDMAIAEMKRSPSFGSSIWNWVAGKEAPPSAPSSRASSMHGGNAFSQRSRSGSMIWNWSDGRDPGPASRNASAHGGSAFAPSTPSRPQSRPSSVHGGGVMGRIWDWAEGRESPAPSLPPSRGASLHGGGAFANLWDWAAGRNSGRDSNAPSRDSSRHGGSKFVTLQTPEAARAR